MLIDGGVGVRLKNLMGEELDEWQEQPGNLERWSTGPKEGGLKAWEKRVLLTQYELSRFEPNHLEIASAPPLSLSGCTFIHTAGLLGVRGTSSARRTISRPRRAAWEC